LIFLLQVNRCFFLLLIFRLGLVSLPLYSSSSSLLRVAHPSLPSSRQRTAGSSVPGPVFARGVVSIVTSFFLLECPDDLCFHSLLSPNCCSISSFLFFPQATYCVRRLKREPALFHSSSVEPLCPTSFFFYPMVRNSSLFFLPPSPFFFF